MTTSPHYKTSRGFTLIEMMVSISIFAIVAVVAIGALLKIVDANKKSQSLETSINNLNFIMDSITREMRVGTDYYCGAGQSVPSTLDPGAAHSCTINAGGNQSSWVLAFNSSDKIGTTCHLIHAYYYDGSALWKGEQTGCGIPITTYYPILSGSILDSKLTFEVGSVNVVTGNSAVQPYAQVHFKGTVGASTQTQSSFDLQTTISQRLPD